MLGGPERLGLAEKRGYEIEAVIGKRPPLRRRQLMTRRVQRGQALLGLGVGRGEISLVGLQDRTVAQRHAERVVAQVPVLGRDALRAANAAKMLMTVRNVHPLPPA